MTSKDKSSEQLVASMRKSKTGAVARKTAARSAASKPAATGKTPATKRKPAQSSARGNPIRAKAKPAAKTPVSVAERSSGFSYGRRVWPD